MPGFDGTGPRGCGPRTGRGLGYCGAGYRHRPHGFRRGYYGRRHGFGPGPGFGPGYGPGPGPGYGSGYGYGRGFGPGFNRWWGGEPEPYYGSPGYEAVDEKAYLTEQAALLRAELEELEKRMAELEESPEEK